jgi:hypothetical protein
MTHAGLTTYYAPTLLGRITYAPTLSGRITYYAPTLSGHTTYAPTRSRGMSLRSLPCFMKTFPVRSRAFSVQVFGAHGRGLGASVHTVLGENAPGFEFENHGGATV